LILLIANWVFSASGTEGSLRARLDLSWSRPTTLVPVTESRRMTEAMKQIGAEVRYTEYPDVGHPCWNKSLTRNQSYFHGFLSKSLPD